MLEPAIPPSPHLHRRLVLFAFAASGASALAFEVIWTRSLALVLGRLGRLEPFAAKPEEIAARVAGMAPGGRALDFALSRDAAQIRRIAIEEPGPLNTDDLPILEFHAVRNLRVGDLARLESGEGP